jgi:hypothetical protein
LTTSPTIQDLQTDVSLVQAALTLPSATVVGTGDYGLVMATLDRAMRHLTFGAQTAEASMASLVALGQTGDGLFAFDTAANAVLALNAATSLAGYLAFGAVTAGYLGRAANTLAAAST